MSFTSTRNTGFWIKFGNGYKVSVQFGPGTYCEHYYSERFSKNQFGLYESELAETALSFDDKLIEYENDEVQGYRTPAQVLELLNYAANLEPKS